LRNIFTYILISWIGCNNLFSQWNNEKNIYNATPFYTINTQNPEDFSGLQELEIYVEGPRVFMSGENHRHVVMNGQIEFKLLRFLHGKAGVRNLLLELGEARGWYANRYVNENDTLYRPYLHATTSEDHMKILDNIREWNLSLPSDKRIQIHGIDVERFNDIAVMRLSDLLPKKDVPESLYAAVHTVHQTAGWLKHIGQMEYDRYRTETPPFYIDASIDLVVSHFDSLDSELKKWLGNRYTDVQSGINNLREYRQWNQYRNSAFYYTWREENMYRKLAALLDKDSSAKFYGQFGRCHSSYVKQDGDCGWYAYHSIMNKLQERFFHSNRGTLSIGVFYEQEMGEKALHEESQTEDKRLQMEISSMLRRAPDASVSISKLDNKQNPVLASRFGFFIAVREYVSAKEKSNNSEKSVALSVGVNFMNLTDANSVAYHINPAWQGKVTSDQSLNLGINWQNTNFSTLVQFGSTGSTEYYEKKDELSIRYLLRYQGIYTGLRFLKRKKYNMDLGPQLLHTTQLIKCNRYGGGFLNPDPSYEKKVKNHAISAGFQFRMQYRLISHISTGIAAGYLYDLSKPDWFIANSNIYYARNQLQTKVTGSSFSVFFNFDL
jgi:hypothetical protein